MRGGGEMHAAAPLLALRQALVTVLEVVTTEKRRQYADDFIRSLNFVSAEGGKLREAADGSAARGNLTPKPG
jgi:hypothetical protein